MLLRREAHPAVLYPCRKTGGRFSGVFPSFLTLKKKVRFIMKEKKTMLAVGGVILLPPALLLLILADLAFRLPAAVFDLSLVTLFLLYGLCADLYRKFRSGIRHKATLQSLNAAFYFLWMVVLAYRIFTRPGLTQLPLIFLLFALALTLFVLSLRKFLLLREDSGTGSLFKKL